MEPHPPASSLTTFEDVLACRPDFAWPRDLRERIPSHEDPLRVVDALREAQILDVRCECIRMTAGILLEMRTAIDLVGHDAALIVARGVRLCSWDLGERENIACPPEAIYGAAWWVGGSQLEPMSSDDGLLELTVACTTSTWLRIRAERFDYFPANVPDLPPIPDYGAGPDHLVRSSIPDWKKPCRLTGYSRRDRNRP